MISSIWLKKIWHSRVNKKLLKWLFFAVTLLVFISLGLFFLVRGSLPLLNGTLSIAGLSHPVVIERDAMGVALIRAENRIDAARATGFLHAQDRFFQMDLMRRMASGELAELVGESALPIDRERRIHLFRKEASQILKQLTPFELKLIEAYTEGVNAGIHSLSCKPFEYILLASSPKPWIAEDCVLVGLGLFFELQDSMGNAERIRGILKEKLPPAAYQFLIHNGSIWHAPLDQSKRPPASIPSAEHFAYLSSPAPIQLKPIPEARGSNQWAVSREKTKEKHALLACDMHLNLFVPNTWYCLHLEYKTTDGQLVQMGGVSLPGTPLIAIGSNRHIAWGFTDAYIPTTDLVILNGDATTYQTPNGPQPFQTSTEEILIHGKKPDRLLIRSTIWGPIHPERFLGKEAAICWIAHHPESFNFRLIDLETIHSADRALEIAPKIGIPVMNFIVADSSGQIGWTYMGTIPQRKGYLPEVPISFADGNQRWDGYLFSPKIFAPSDHILWTANNQVIDDPTLGIEYLNSIRAYQIRQRLVSSNELTLESMAALQLDDEALFFERWRRLLLDSLDLDQPSHHALKNLIEREDLFCSSESLSYNWIRSFREKVICHLTARFIAPCLDGAPIDPYLVDFEEPFFSIASQKPSYLVDPQFSSWKQELYSLIDQMFIENDIDHPQRWGQNNQAQIKHPLSGALPWFSRFLDMPCDSLSGDYYVPHVSGPSVGASVRFVVEPGFEEKGILSVPCGQSGHPLSPHYRDQHCLWTKGIPSPFLPGKPFHTLTLNPD